MYLIDKEGQISTREISIAVSRKNCRYTAIEAIYTWETEKDLNRFLRFQADMQKNTVLPIKETKHKDLIGLTRKNRRCKKALNNK